MMRLKQLFCKHKYKLDFNRRFFPAVSGFISDIDGLEFQETCQKCGKVHSGKYNKVLNID